MATSVATFRSNKTREELVSELDEVLGETKSPRVYIISKDQGGKFFFGKRKVAPWHGYAQVSVESGDEE